MLSVAKKLCAKAKKLYLEGLRFRSIGRVLEVSHVSILRRIRASDVKKPLSAVKEAPEGIELNEMWHYQGKKNKQWTWVALDRKTRQALAIGDRSQKTGKLLWEQIKHIPTPRCYTDAWRAYCHFLPSHKMSNPKRKPIKTLKAIMPE